MPTDARGHQLSRNDQAEIARMNEENARAAQDAIARTAQQAANAQRNANS